MDQGKVTAITVWPIPQSVKELQRFLGFANFYQRFIQDFSLHMAPLTTMRRGKPKSLSWNSSAHEAFEKLKTTFSTAPILRHPDPQVPFVVEVDASTTGVRAVLSQLFGEPPRLQPCAYYSKKLTPDEQNYDIAPSSPHCKSHPLEHRRRDQSRHSNRTHSVGRPRRENIRPYSPTAVPSGLSS